MATLNSGIDVGSKKEFLIVMRAAFLSKLAAGLLAATALFNVAQAQPAKPAAVEPAPTLTIVLKSENELLGDLKFILTDLGGAPSEFKTLEDTITAVMLGIDPAGTLIRRSYQVDKDFIDTYTVKVDTAAKLKDMLTNFNDLSITTRPDRETTPPPPNTYKLTGIEHGTLRHDIAAKLAFFALLGDKPPTKVRATAARKLILGLKTTDATKLLAGNDFVAILEHDATNAAARKEAFELLSKEAIPKERITPKGQKEPKETVAQFNLRKAVTEQQIAEGERFYLESERIFIGWKLDAAAKNAVLSLDLVALPSTTPGSLAESVELIGKTPDQFAGVTKEGAISWWTVNFPIDELRKKHVKEIAKSWIPVVNEQIDKGTAHSDADKQLDKDLVKLLSDIVASGVDLGVTNSFARVFPSSGGGYTTVAGVRVPDGGVILPALEKLKAHTNIDVELNVEKIDDLSLHKVIIKGKAPAQLADLLGAGGIVYVATSKDTAWAAMGTDAEKVLKQAIADVKKTGPKPGPGVEAHTSLAPWIEVLDRAVDTKTEKKEDTEGRKAALAELKKGKDTMDFKLDRDGKTVKMHIKFDEGLLRAAGKVMARVVKEKFAE